MAKRCKKREGDVRRGKWLWNEGKGFHEKGRDVMRREGMWKEENEGERGEMDLKGGNRMIKEGKRCDKMVRDAKKKGRSPGGCKSLTGKTRMGWLEQGVLGRGGMGRTPTKHFMNFSL